MRVLLFGKSLDPNSKDKCFFALYAAVASEQLCSSYLAAPL